MILRYWLRARDEERKNHPRFPKRDRDIMALRRTVWYADGIARHFMTIADKEVRKP